MKELLTDYNLQIIERNKMLLIKPLQRIFESIQKCQNLNFNDFAKEIKEIQKTGYWNQFLLLCSIIIGCDDFFAQFTIKK